MGGVNMAKIKVKDNEEMDHALRRFKKECQKSG
ncbi:MAG: 30S ribosomal protein S21, partial [Atribacterota bacterium]